MTRSVVLPLAMLANLWIGSSCQDDKHVGSRDCQVIAEASNLGNALELCQACQDAGCPNDRCEALPCVNGHFVAQGCEEDGDCAGLPTGTGCGHFSAPNRFCTVHPDAR